MLAGEAYDSMQDQDLLEGRLRARKLMFAYNNYPPPTYTKGFKVSDFFGELG